MRKKAILRLIILGAIGGIIAAGYGLREYNRKLKSVSDLKTDFKVTSQELYLAYEMDETSADEKYRNKVLEVSGIVETVSNTDSLSTVILKVTESSLGGINCSTSADVSSVQPGQSITIKGICQGYLMDVILNQCVLAE